MYERTFTEPYFTEGHHIFRKTIRDFVEKELAPNSREWEKACTFPREVFQKFGKLGALGIRFDPKFGGAGLDYWYSVSYIEEMPRSRMAGLNMSILVQSDMATPVINDLGTPEQKKEFLEPAIKGEKIAAIGVSEPWVGSDVANLRTTAKRVGGDYVINGAKTFITNGTRADFITLMVRTGEPGYGGISILLFPTDTKGFKVSRALEKIGNHTSDTAELAFEDCKVPARNLLGEENQGFIYLMQNFQSERLTAGISAPAGAELMWMDAERYASERVAFGKPIGKFQVWKHRLVDLMTEIEAGRRLAYHAADLYNRKIPCTKEISMAKLFCGEMVNRVADACLQIHGGYGYIEEYDIARAWRDARLITIGGGTSEIMREIISKTLGL